MIRYLKSSPLWHHLINNFQSMPPSLIANTIIINKNLMKGYAALKLYQCSDGLQELTNIVDTSHLDEYDLKRIKATSERVPAKLSGLERYEASLQPLYIESIQDKNNKYYQYFEQLSRKNKIDIIDLYILVSNKSSQRCFQIAEKLLAQTELPQFFIFHIQKMMLECENRLSFKFMKRMIGKLNLQNEISKKLAGVLRMKTITENISEKNLEKISNQETLNKILDKIDQDNMKILRAYFNDGEDIMALEKVLTSINTMVNFDDNISLELKERIANLTKSYLPLLPRRNIFKDKVAQKEKELKIELLKYQQEMRNHITKHIKLFIEQQSPKKVQYKIKNKSQSQTKIEQTIRYIDVIKTHKLSKMQKWAEEQTRKLIDQMIENPVYFLNFPNIFIKLFSIGIRLKYKQKELERTADKFFDSFKTDNIEQTLKNLFILEEVTEKNNLGTILIKVQKIIDRLLQNSQYKQTPRVVELVNYLKNPQIYNTCEVVEIMMGDAIELIRYIHQNVLDVVNDNYSLLSGQDLENIYQFQKIVKETKRKRVKSYEGQEDVLRYVIEGKQVKLVKTQLFSPIFQCLHSGNKQINKDNLRLDQQSKQHQMEMQIAGENKVEDEDDKIVQESIDFSEELFSEEEEFVDN